MTDAAQERGVILHADGKLRCPWPGTDPYYIAYHDTDWGVPELDDRPLFEKLILDGFQAGLSWITILRKRENFRAAFDGFEPARIVHYGPAKIDALMGDAGIIRNRAKIEGTIKNARATLKLHDEVASLSEYLWNFVDGRPIRTPGPLSLANYRTTSSESDALSKDLKRRGFTFVGSTIMYAFMQAVGMVNDHEDSCFKAPSSLQRR